MSAHDGLRRTWVLASREIVERGGSRAFKYATLAAILLMAAIILLPSLLSDDSKTYHIGLAGAVALGTSDALTAQAEAADVRVRMTTLNQDDQPVQTMIGHLLVFRRSGEAT